MHRPSIYDRLQHRRRTVVRPEDKRPVAGHDYLSDRVRLIDGVALTAAGFVLSGTALPQGRQPVLSQTLSRSAGAPLLVHPIEEFVPVEEPRLRTLDAKALRLDQLVQTVLIDALMMLDLLERNAGFDVVLSVPRSSPRAHEIMLERLHGAITESEYGEFLGCVRCTTEGRDPHTAMSAPVESGGMSYVLWISVDSLLNDGDVATLARDGQLEGIGNGGGLRPGEAVAVVLAQRLRPGETTFESGWILAKGVSHGHAPRSAQSSRERCAALQTLMEQAWSDGAPGLWANEPAYIVVDSLGLPGRAAEAGKTLANVWSTLDLIEDGVVVDSRCGWPGEALSALELVLAVTSLRASEEALVLDIAAESDSRVMTVRSAQKIPDTKDEHSRQ